jgi:acyl carrier protein
MGMNNKDKYDRIFQDCFSIGRNQLNGKLEYNSIKEWDSIGHMGMVAAIEETFDIMMETDDILDFGSYKKGFELLAKYGVKFELVNI